MERMNRVLSLLMLAGMIGVGSLGAGDPATQPAVSPDMAVSTPAPANDSGNQANPQGRQNRRNRGGGGGGGGAALIADGSNPTGLDKYAVLKTRSIFVKGNQTTNATPPPRPVNFRPNNGLTNKSRSSLVFNGVIVMGDEPNAMIEDQSSSNSTVTLLRKGDPIAAGRLSSITFDDITYEENGNEKKVELGQNMDGEFPVIAVVVPPAPSTQPGSVAPAVDSTAGAAPAGGAPAAGGTSAADDILAKMKAKRNAELGIK